eukprot:jgi/Picre1/32495/NNA_007841.t1
MNEDAIRCIGRTARGPVSADATQLESGTPLESPADGCRVCRICWVSLEKDDPDVVSPCRCKGSMEYIHIDCLKAWQDQLCRMKGKNPLYCDVCHQAYTVNTRLLHHRVRRIVMSMTHSRIAPLIAIIFRAAQHYVCLPLIDDERAGDCSDEHGIQCILLEEGSLWGTLHKRAQGHYWYICDQYSRVKDTEWGIGSRLCSIQGY